MLRYSKRHDTTRHDTIRQETYGGATQEAASVARRRVRPVLAAHEQRVVLAIRCRQVGEFKPNIDNFRLLNTLTVEPRGGADHCIDRHFCGDKTTEERTARRWRLATSDETCGACCINVPV